MDETPVDGFITYSDVMAAINALGLTEIIQRAATEITITPLTVKTLSAKLGDNGKFVTGDDGELVLTRRVYLYGHVMDEEHTHAY